MNFLEAVEKYLVPADPKDTIINPFNFVSNVASVISNASKDSKNKKNLDRLKKEGPEKLQKMQEKEDRNAVADRILKEAFAKTQNEKQNEEYYRPPTPAETTGPSRSEQVPSPTELQMREPAPKQEYSDLAKREIAKRQAAKEEAEFKEKFGVGYEDIPVTADVPKDDIRAMNQPTGNALSFEPVADEKTPSAPMGNMSTEIGESAPEELDEKRMAQLYRKTTGAEYNPEVSKAAREKMAQLKSFVSSNPDMLNKSDTRIALDFYKSLKDG